VDAHGMPVRVVITEGTRADCQEAERMIDGFEAEALIADKGYDTQEVLDAAKARGMEVVIPPKKNRKDQRDYDRYLYKLWHLVENGFLQLKAWRGIATRYAKNASSYLAAVQIRCIVWWLSIL
jgi:transposase